MSRVYPLSEVWDEPCLTPTLTLTLTLTLSVPG